MCYNNYGFEILYGWGFYIFIYSAWNNFCALWINNSDSLNHLSPLTPKSATQYNSESPKSSSEPQIYLPTTHSQYIPSPSQPSVW
jgi:hypothetical protein